MTAPIVELAPDGASRDLDALPPIDAPLEAGTRLVVGTPETLRLWVLRAASNGLGTAALRVRAPDGVFWLARDASGPGVTLDGARRPAGVEVPATWAFSAARFWLERGARSSVFPWHAEPGLAPPGDDRAPGFGYAALRADPSLVGPLRAWLEEALRAHGFDGADAAIAELRRVGHDLWSQDVDGPWQLWGPDYMRRAEGRGLWLELDAEAGTAEVRFEPELG